MTIHVCMQDQPRCIWLNRAVCVHYGFVVPQVSTSIPVNLTKHKACFNRPRSTPYISSRNLSGANGVLPVVIRLERFSEHHVTLLRSIIPWLEG